MTKSIIAGATGLVGLNIARQLATQKEQTIALVRRSVDGLPERTEILEIDFQQFLISGKLPLCDHLYLCLGTTIKTAGSRSAFQIVDFDYALGIAKKAREAGATGLSLVSSVGADARSTNFYLRTKGQLEVAVKSLGFSRVNIYRPGLLRGKRSNSRFLEGVGQVVFRFIGPLLVGPLSNYRSIQADLLAQTMIDNADKGEGVNYFHFKQFNTN
ncbi:MAG: hypothetical protein P8Q37_08360 [Porticoccaceae bacterium]|nr:hypothetical protein [Porticoccaceae bacterium]MDG1474904.1 hypothetical protein [Porticoccaceae bacterium]